MSKSGPKRSEELAPGDEALYVPGPDHWHEVDSRGEPVWEFVFAQDGPPLSLARQAAGEFRVRAGDPVTQRFGLGEQGLGAPLGAVEAFEPDGTIRLSRGYVIRAVGPKAPWPAVARESVEATLVKARVVFEGKEVEALVPREEKRLVLDVVHPGGVVTLHLPLSGPGAVRHDPEKGPHSWHRPEEA